MKPTGPIPADYRAEGGALLIGGRTAEALVAAAGDTPLFVYDLAIVRARIARLRQALPPQIQIHYAMKANPYGELLRERVGLVDGIDVASAGELAAAIDAGARAETISFAGPGKRDDELARAIAAGVTLNLESEGEADRALAIAAKTGYRPGWPCGSIPISSCADRGCGWVAARSRSGSTRTARPRS
jgi:diaminopimelate decarboxylase